MSGLEILNHEKVAELELKNAIDYDKVDEHTKFLIFPISVIGCGKTTTSQTLNYYPKKEIKCVIVDRNNHQFRERKQLFEWLDELKEDYLAYDTNIKVIGVSFAPYDKLSEIRDITMQRVIKRGNNHQSIKWDELGEKKVVGIMNGFLKRYQPVNLGKSPDNMFDLMVELDFGQADTSLTNAKQILNEIHKTYPILVPLVPKDDEFETAFRRSLDYKPTVRKMVGKGNNNQPKTPNDADLTEQFKHLLTSGKVQEELHITLGHVISSREKEAKKLWKSYCNRYTDQITEYNNNRIGNAQGSGNNQNTQLKTTDKLNFRLEKLCWDEKIIAIVVELSKDKDGCIIDENNEKIKGLCCQNKIPHITLCKLESGVKAVYSNVLCEKVESAEVDENIKVVKLDNSKEFVGSVYLNF
ncbi:CPA_1a_G0029310.mRNA.1.CDS.1 [Saccharomyces cerevisiae]|nr:CPA_1a_G0029310.mRNA.1.CDS.1 [Saccharomyces cerevisiae]CAI7356920.1 CPA_1a_G0029310.mRNA.1.CDS.1 [Saccharomyces cerevisiae]